MLSQTANLKCSVNENYVGKLVALDKTIFFLDRITSFMIITKTFGSRDAPELIASCRAKSRARDLKYNYLTEDLISPMYNKPVFR